MCRQHRWIVRGHRPQLLKILLRGLHRELHRVIASAALKSYKELHSTPSIIPHVCICNNRVSVEVGSRLRVSCMMLYSMKYALSTSSTSTYSRSSDLLIAGIGGVQDIRSCVLTNFEFM